MWYSVVKSASYLLRFLSLQLSGTIPASVGNLSELTQLSLGFNKLSGTIPPVGGLSQLTSLDLGDNRCNGAIPESVGGLLQLIFLNFGTNLLSGSIPAVGGLSQLEQVYLDNNKVGPSLLPTHTNADRTAAQRNDS